jgi:hypothetical protein
MLNSTKQAYPKLTNVVLYLRLKAVAVMLFKIDVYFKRYICVFVVLTMMTQPYYLCGYIGALLSYILFDSYWFPLTVLWRDKMDVPSKCTIVKTIE